MFTRAEDYYDRYAGNKEDEKEIKKKQNMKMK